MTELESVIEKKLIEQLARGESQWTYRPELNNEEKLWANFRYILEQNNKAKLGDKGLSDDEFAQVKNRVSHASFYDAGKWLSGENGLVQVHIQRGSELLHLTVLNQEQVAGGTTVYEVINQYQAFKEPHEEMGRNRRFDVTLLINGLPMIHIELKNKAHSYMDGFRQIKKYIGEGKFQGIFSNVQMFVVSNSVDTRYFAAARDTELNSKFLTGWLDADNNPVGDYLEFAKAVLKIPEAHEMVSKYTVLDNDKQRLIILRPYQVHAIEEMRKASKRGVSGYIWHTTGSGKTMTSHKGTRNLLMDIPSLDKTIFLIDRKDLDDQTTMAFQSYAENDTVDVDETDNVGDLMKKLSNNDRQMIVTTRQKLQIVMKRLTADPDSAKYKKVKEKRIAFVVDECHRAVSPATKRDIEKFFYNSLWYGFTGTPIFEDNQRAAQGDLARTTKQLYGDCLHSYTIKEAIHDEAVLGFMVENLGSKNLKPDAAAALYNSDTHRYAVLDTILNKSYAKFGMQKGRGQTYEAILTVSSIAEAQKYYEILKKVAAGTDEHLKVSEKIRKALPDFPKFAITYSISENAEGSKVNQDKMKESLADYNAMFGTHYTMDNIRAYNGNLNERLARKESRYKLREEQLDLVIVVDRLLTGFDAPCMSTLFIDRLPMSPQDLIQAFSRTNRLFDKNKTFGQIVTFQYPEEFKAAIDDAIKLYSRGGDGNPLSEDWGTVFKDLVIAIKAIHEMGRTPDDIKALSRDQKKAFVKQFRALDRAFSHLKAFSQYDDSILSELDFSEEEYENYAAVYKNIMEELKPEKPDEEPDQEPIMDDYELVAFHRLKIDYDYIMELLRGMVAAIEETEEEFIKKVAEVREIIEEFAADNPKLGELLHKIVDEVEADKSRFIGKDIGAIIRQMREDAADTEIKKFSEKWCIPFEDVKYEAYQYRDGEMSNPNIVREKADFAAYKVGNGNGEYDFKFEFQDALIKDFHEKLMPEITEMLDN